MSCRSLLPSHWNERTDKLRSRHIFPLDWTDKSWCMHPLHSRHLLSYCGRGFGDTLSSWNILSYIGWL